MAAELGGVGYAAGMNLPLQLQAQVLGIAAAALWSAAITGDWARCWERPSDCGSVQTRRKRGSISRCTANARTTRPTPYLWIGSPALSGGPAG